MRFVANGNWGKGILTPDGMTTATQVALAMTRCGIRRSWDGQVAFPRPEAYDEASAETDSLILARNGESQHERGIARD
jgi:hypothetical protein